MQKGSSFQNLKNIQIRNIITPICGNPEFDTKSFTILFLCQLVIYNCLWELIWLILTMIISQLIVQIAKESILFGENFYMILLGRTSCLYSILLKIIISKTKSEQFLYAKKPADLKGWCRATRCNFVFTNNKINCKRKKSNQINYIVKMLQTK